MIHTMAALLLLKSGAEDLERRRRLRPTHVSPPSLSRAALPRLLRRAKHFFLPAPRSSRAAARTLRPSSTRSAPAAEARDSAPCPPRALPRRPREKVSAAPRAARAWPRAARHRLCRAWRPPARGALSPWRR